MTTIPVHALNDGNQLPAIGFGTYPLKGDEGADAVASALSFGYRLLDTAVNYRNEDAVGRGIRQSGLPREDVQVTTKLPGRHHAYEDALRSFEESRKLLGVEYVDLYIIHWPNPSVGKFVDAWKALVTLQNDGLARSIGVSNFTPEHIGQIVDATGVVPAVNQIEVHPYFPQEELISFHREHNILTEAWSPLGKGSAPGEEQVVQDAAAAHGVSPAQVMLRWHTQRGVVPIPKSSKPERQRENLDIFGFELSDDEVSAITALGRSDGRLFGGDPNTHEEQ